MSVFDDPRKELEALQAQLEQQEDWFEQELEAAKRMIGEAPRAARPTSAGAGIPGAGRTPQPKVRREVPRQEQPQKEQPKKKQPKKKGIRGLVILAILETLGIAGIAVYWLLYLL